MLAPADLPVQKMFDAVDKLRHANRLGELIESFELFDLYRPQDVQAEKSMAFRIRLSTLGDEAISDEQADAAVQAVVAALEPLGAKLRS